VSILIAQWLCSRATQGSRSHCPAQFMARRQRQTSSFTSEELVKVLSHYDIGVIRRVRSLTAGSGRAPKVIVISDAGRFFLKRRPTGKEDLHRVELAHSLQDHLARYGFPVTELVPTRTTNQTILQIGRHIYELFRFVSGVRYDGSAEATIDAGRQLANFHRHLADFSFEPLPIRGSFHDSASVRNHIKAVGQAPAEAGDGRWREVSEALMVIYNNASVQVNQLGFDSWPQQVVHGDWHPGNMLYSHRRIKAVLDFDSVKVAPPITDLANGMLQFSIVGDRPNPSDWPPYLDQAKLVQFLDGYRQITDPTDNQVDSLLDLMIETMIAEAVLPVATTGFFGHASGCDFLMMIRRKADWIYQNRHRLTEAMLKTAR